MTELELVVVPSPALVYRVARWPGDPFTPSPWAIARPDGTFGNRFDDPGGGEGLPLERRFRVISCATQRAAAVGETIARFRPTVALLARLAEIPDSNPLDPADYGVMDSAHLSRGLVPADWRRRRQLGSTRLDPGLRFVDIAAAESLTVLRQALAPVADRVGMTDIDLSTVTGPQRAFTQACARFVFEQRTPDGAPRYAGIRYGSRLHREWECWAIFADRLWQEPALPELLAADDPGLMEAAAVLGLVIEGR